MSGYTPEVALAHALESLSKARTSLDDPSGLPERDHQWWEQGEANEYTIAMIDDAMRLLSPEKKYGLIVALDGEFTTRAFDAPDEGPGAIREAIALKERQPQSVVTIVIDQF